MGKGRAVAENQAGAAAQCETLLPSPPTPFRSSQLTCGRATHSWVGTTAGQSRASASTQSGQSQRERDNPSLAAAHASPEVLAAGIRAGGAWPPPPTLPPPLSPPPPFVQPARSGVCRHRWDPRASARAVCLSTPTARARRAAGREGQTPPCGRAPAAWRRGSAPRPPPPRATHAERKRQGCARAWGPTPCPPARGWWWRSTLRHGGGAARERKGGGACTARWKRIAPPSSTTTLPPNERLDAPSPLSRARP